MTKKVSFYNVYDVTKWLFFNVFHVVFTPTEKRWTQANHQHKLFDVEKANKNMFRKARHQVLSPPLSVIEQKLTLMRSELEKI